MRNGFRAFGIALLLLLATNCFAAQDVIEAPEKDEPIAVESINEEVRKLYVETNDNATDIATNTTNIATNTVAIAAISVPEFGAWDTGAPWTVGTNYLAATDGFVLAYKISGASGISIKTDSASPPTTVRSFSAGAPCSAISPVKSGEYWRVECGNATVIYWIPLN